MDWATTATIVGGVAGILAALVKLFPPVRKIYLNVKGALGRAQRKADAIWQLGESMRAIRKVSAMRHFLDLLMHRIGCQRALLLTANNGGKSVWQGKGPLYVSNPAQVVGPGEPNTIDLWQDWKCDQWYVEFLGRTLETIDSKRGIQLVTENDVGGELLEQYKEQGTVASVVLPFIWRDGGVLWYVSLNFGRYPTRESGSTESELTDAENRNYLANANELYSNHARCRAMINELLATWNSVR